MAGQTEDKSVEDRPKAPSSSGAKRWFDISLLPVTTEGFMCIFLFMISKLSCVVHSLKVDVENFL